MDAIGISMHHDSITGTSKQNTIFDLVNRIDFASKNITNLYE